MIGFELKAEYDEFAHFKEKYGLDIKIKFDPLASFESETNLLEEDEPATEYIPEVSEQKPEQKKRIFSAKRP